MQSPIVYLTSWRSVKDFFPVEPRGLLLHQFKEEETKEDASSLETCGKTKLLSNQNELCLSALMKHERRIQKKQRGVERRIQKRNFQANKSAHPSTQKNFLIEQGVVVVVAAMVRWCRSKSIWKGMKRVSINDTLVRHQLITFNFRLGDYLLILWGLYTGMNLCCCWGAGISFMSFCFKASKFNWVCPLVLRQKLRTLHFLF